MKLKNILIVVNDIEKSKAFYKDLFGLDVVSDFGENVILTEGLVLQERKVWEKLLGREIVSGGHDAELFFVEKDMHAFIQKLKNCPYPVKYAIPIMENAWGQPVVRIYDLDGHLIEIAGSRN